jgi:hypothetical protein
MMISTIATLGGWRVIHIALKAFNYATPAFTVEKIVDAVVAANQT